MKSYWGVEHGEVSKGLFPLRVKALKVKGGKGKPSVKVPGVSVHVPKGPDTDRMLRGGPDPRRIMHGAPDTDRMLRGGPDIGKITAGAPDVLAMLRGHK